MAISDQQKVALFQALEVPLFDTVGLLHGESNLNQQPFNSGSSIFQAKSAIEAHLVDLADNYSGYEDQLKILLDKWESLGTQSWQLDGGTSGIQGIGLAPSDERIEVRRQILPIVPFYRAHEEMSRIGAESQSFDLIR